MEKFTEILREKCDLSGMASRLTNDSPSEALYLGYITFYKWIPPSNYPKSLLIPHFLASVENVSF